VPHFEGGVGITTDFPENWPQCHRPESQPFFEGAVFEEFSLCRRLPLESHPHRGDHLFQFCRAQRVPLVAFAPIVSVFLVSKAEAESFVRFKVELDILVGHVEEDHLVLSHASTRCQM